MRVTAWRIVKTKYAATAFDGEGARRFSGRWNSAGVAMAYAAEIRALAALELLVHLDRTTITVPFVFVGAEFDSGLVQTLDNRQIPVEWRRSPPPDALKGIGDGWIHAARKPVLRVPSAVIPNEWCYLINPAHPDFGMFRFMAADPFNFDTRLAR